MWELSKLIKMAQDNQAQIKGKWVPVRPENFKHKQCSIWRRLRYAWQVVIGKAETLLNNDTNVIDGVEGMIR
jgi:hypothetical protein